MRHFILDGQIFSVKDGQFTADEILKQGLNKVACAPSGAVDVTEFESEIFEYAATHTSTIEDGALVWTEKTTSMTDEEITQARKIAHSDPLAGSYPLYIEYQAKLALDSEDAGEAKRAWLDRRAEIEAEYPYND